MCLIYEMDRSDGSLLQDGKCTRNHPFTEYQVITYLENIHINCQVKPTLRVSCTKIQADLATEISIWKKEIYRDFTLGQILDGLLMLQQPPESKFGKWLAGLIRYRCLLVAIFKFTAFLLHQNHNGVSMAHSQFQTATYFATSTRMALWV